MKKLMTAMILAAAVLFGMNVKAEKAAKKTAVSAEKMQQACDKYMATLKTMDEAKYNEVNAITDVKAKLTAARTAIIDVKLADLKKSDEAKYNSLMELKTSNPKEFNKEVAKLVNGKAAAKKPAKKAAAPAAEPAAAPAQ